MHMHLKDLRGGYVDVLRAVAAEGVPSAPRGRRTYEVLGFVMTVEDPHAVLPRGVGRKVAPRLAALEALQLIGGYSDVAQAKAVSPALAAHEDMGRFHGAYGPRVLPQLAAAVRRLTEDEETRRSVINVWDPVQDLFVNDGIRNYPCTTQLQFFIRRPHGFPQLTLYVTMRANDAWKGLAYDAFTFAQLQLTVSRALGVAPGPYVHHATSMHIYEEDLDKVAALRHPDGPQEPEPDGVGLDNPWAARWALGADEGSPMDAVRVAVRRARSIGSGVLPHDATEHETWYHDLLGRTPATGAPDGL